MVQDIEKQIKLSLNFYMHSQCSGCRIVDSEKDERIFIFS